ncbi:MULTISPECIES: YbjQ family protein [Actinomadura]|nr:MULTISPECIES: heavy metal-binding domain-containing protein [Actinomadura]MXQ63768.1 heavy metal-binding domain-containing protein [Actinomadura rayongensis]
MLIVTTDGLAGYVIRNVLGEALGTSVHVDHGPGAPTPPPGSPSSATFRVAGEGLGGTRRAAVERLAEDAHRKGANAVVGMCFETVPLSGGGHEVCAYGTAVWAEPQHGAPPAQQQPPQHQQNYSHHSQNVQYTEPQPGGPPMAARNLTIGLHDQPR